MIPDNRRVIKARNKIFNNNNYNLLFLLKSRYDWIKQYVTQNETGVELGSGSGHSKLFMPGYNYITTDILEIPWLDKHHIDAHNTSFEKESFDYIILENVLHHLDKPVLFFNEADRLLKSGGKIIIFEPFSSFFLKLALKLTKHEHCYDQERIFDQDYSFLSTSKDFWDGNNSIARMIFDQPDKFLSEYPQFEIKHKSYAEFFVFLNSGGVYMENYYIPLNNYLLKKIKKIDDMLIKFSPKVFALAIRVVLEKKN
jgi:SAM-dependent methyltransferase